MFTLLVRLVVSLGVVIGLMLILAGTLRKRGILVGGASGGGRNGKARSAAMLDIVARKPLGRNAQLAVVRAGDKTLVIGITEHQITMLSETDSAWLDEPSDGNLFDADQGSEHSMETQRTGFLAAAQRGTFPTWKTMLEDVRDRTVRR